MVETLKNMIQAGIGGAAIIGEKFHDFVAELIIKGHISESEGKKMLDDYLKKVLVEKEKLRKTIHSAIDKQLERSPLASKAELMQMQEEYAQLKKRLDEIEK